MKLKTMALATVIAVMALTPKVHADSCMQEYKERIDKISTYYSGINAGDLLYANVVGGSGGYLIAGATFGFLDFIIGNFSSGILPVFGIATGVGIGIPAVLTAGYVADTIADAPFVKMMRVIERANIEAGVVNDEPLRTDFRSEIPVDGVTREEIRYQRNLNRHARKHNRTLKRLNNKVSSRINKRKNAFDDLISNLEKIKGRKVDRVEVAKLVVEADVQEKLCNSDVRLADHDLTLRTDHRNDYIRVTGETALEKMKQRHHNRQIENHNKQVNRHNNKIAQLIKRKDLAKLKHLVNYLDSQLP
jgi:hypothetical protein